LQQQPQMRPQGSAQLSTMLSEVLSIDSKSSDKNQQQQE
jgi:hypothetical protein